MVIIDIFLFVYKSLIIAKTQHFHIETVILLDFLYFVFNVLNLLLCLASLVGIIKNKKSILSIQDYFTLIYDKLFEYIGLQLSVSCHSYNVTIIISIPSLPLSLPLCLSFPLISTNLTTSYRI